jgi:hypothetical protein
MKYWEIIADNLDDIGWSLGWVSAVNRDGRTIWITDAHGDGKHFIVRADEMLTAFVGTAKGDARVRGEFDLLHALRSGGCVPLSLFPLN